VSSILSAGNTVDLIDGLKTTIEEFAARSDKLNEELRLKSAKERQRCAVATAALKQELATQSTDGENEFQKRKTALLAKYEHRKTWIGDAYQSSKEHGLQKIENTIGARKYELQKTTLQAEKDREAGLARATAAREEFSREIAAQQENLASYEREAQRLLKGYRRLVRFFFKAYELAEVSHEQDQNRLMAQLRELLSRAQTDLAQLRSSSLFRLLRYLPLWLVLALCVLGAMPVLEYFGIHSLSYGQAGVVVVAGVALLIGMRLFAQRRAAPSAHSLSQALARARRVHDLCKAAAESSFQSGIQNIHTQFQEKIQHATDRLREAQAKAGDLRVKCRTDNDKHAVQVTSRNEALHRAKLQRLEREQKEAAELRVRSQEERIKALIDGSEAKIAGFAAEQAAGWQMMETEWKTRTSSIYETLQSTRVASEQMFPPWTDSVWKAWKPPTQFGQAARFGELKIE